ncbi:helix-turn-helix transcriptional regulator [Spirochaeta cellobiosiphila]|uniref:helix-turn-helix transcriptional regulator n=1 Tax=Spirochaeta cellobiosiphila TaxID=504483 RepID=UPI0004078F11|nr:YafY family protein [Spirochaeta cellobiosiphila]
MYNPTLRLLTLLEILESHKSISGDQLAKRLEVDKRTIRRYIVNLQELGIPVSGERGPYGSYSLQKGSRLPPLIFNDSEASAIIIGLITLNQMNFPIDHTSVEGAMAKIERLLPQNLLDYVNDLKDLIKIDNPPYYSNTQIPHNDFVLMMAEVIQRRKRLQITYSTKDGAKTVRNVDLYGVVLVGGVWYTAGYCHLREELRIFRMDRVISISKVDVEFIRPEDFDLLNFVLQSLKPVKKSFETEILLKTTLEKAKRLLPSEIYLLEETSDGVKYCQTTSRLDWLAYSLLNIDIPFVIKKPIELYNIIEVISEKSARIVSEAKRIQ